MTRGSDTNNRLIAPHGGALVDRIVTGAHAEALRERAAGLPRVTLDSRELADLELIAIGAASPLTGFLGRSEYVSVLERLRLADRTVWPLPPTLAVADETRASLEPGGGAALHDAGGRLWGTIEIEDVYERDPLIEGSEAYGTRDVSHPGVAYLLARPRWLVGGSVTALPLPLDLPFAERRLAPRSPIWFVQTAAPGPEAATFVWSKNSSVYHDLGCFLVPTIGAANRREGPVARSRMGR